MADKSNIEWTDATWNPVLGCDKVSPGCKNCYAIKTAWRLQHNPNPKVAAAFEGLVAIEGGKPNWTGRVNFVAERLSDPIDWEKPRRIFVNSQSDLFHDGVTDKQIAAAFGVMAATPRHTYQILTKRTDRARAWFEGLELIYLQNKIRHCSAEAFNLGIGIRARELAVLHPVWPLPNVWLGVSVENQKAADERIPLLLQTPAAVRWLSIEPLLAPITFRWARWDHHQPHPRRVNQLPDVERGGKIIAGCVDHLDGLRMLDWVVAGGESGPGARPMHSEWARSLRDQCKAAGVPFFFKQWGEWKPTNSNRGEAGDFFAGIVNQRGDWMRKVGKKAAGRKLDGVEHNEYPEASR